MPAPAKTPRAGTCAAILTLTFCAAATSGATAAWGQSATATTPPTTAPVDVTNSQTQSGDIFAGQTLHVEEASDAGATSSAVAVGNDVLVQGVAQPPTLRSSQTSPAPVTGQASATVDGYSGPILAVTASATANSGQASTDSAETDGTATQTVGPNAVTAQADGSVGSADQVSVDSSAIGNTHGWTSSSGYSNTTTTQNTSGQVSALTSASGGDVGGEIGASATAVANNVTLDSTGADADAKVEQHASGPGVGASTQVNVNSADTVVAVSTATANNVTFGDNGGAVSLNNYQTNDAPVSALGSVTIDNSFAVAQSSAYGVGNSAIVTEVGAGATVFNGQSNTGAVTATASTTGGAGGGYEGIATASAIGNAISTYVCASCNGGVSAENTQVNSGGVRGVSSVTATAGPTGVIAGQSSAVGNHAAFVVKTPGS